MNRIPAWGLYRLFKALKSKEGPGRLDVETASGKLSFGLMAGLPYYVFTDIMHLSFAAYLANVEIINDDMIADVFSRTRGQFVPAYKILTDEQGLQPAKASKYISSYVRSVFSGVLPVEISDWSYVEGLPRDKDRRCEGVDPAPELMRAVGRHSNTEYMRRVVGKFLDGRTFFLAKGGESLLTHAKAHIGESNVLFLVRQGRGREITKETLSDETSLRILFGLTVAGALTRSSVSGAAPRNAVFGDEEVVRELREVVGGLESKNYFELLDVASDARVSIIDEAYNRAKRRYSRKRYADVAGAEVAEHLDTIHAKLDLAMAVLTDRDRRNEYNRAQDIDTPTLNSSLAQIFDARDVWLTGITLNQEGKVDDALLRFEEADRQDPLEPIYGVSIANALLVGKPETEAIGRAEQLLERALDDNDRMVAAHVGMAKLSRLRGNRIKAMEHARKALVLEPDNEEARRIKELLNTNANPSKIDFKRKHESIVEKLKDRFKLNK